jgi:hypothetical protein
MKSVITVALFLISVSFAELSAQQINENLLLHKIDSCLVKLTEVKNKAVDINKCFESFYPIAIAVKDSLYIYDNPGNSSKYTLVKKTAQPFPIPSGIQASFPLSVYDNKAVCVITPTTFTKPDGNAFILHEFIHCCQFNSVETEIKEELSIYKEAMEKQDYMWEMNHPFPYNDTLYCELSGLFKSALISNNVDAAKKIRLEIKNHLSKNDFEYLLWQEWKEGFARYNENKIRAMLGLEINNYGSDEPYDRVSFYYSGDLLSGRLIENEPGLINDMRLLYERMKSF